MASSSVGMRPCASSTSLTSYGDREALKDLLSYGLPTPQAKTVADAFPLPRRLGSAVRTLFLLGGSVFCALVALCGALLLGYLMLTRSLTPPQLAHERVLYMDLEPSGALSAQVDFLGLRPRSFLVQRFAPVLPPDRFLTPGEVVDVWLDLDLPGGAAASMVQTQALLLSSLSREEGRSGAEDAETALQRATASTSPSSASPSPPGSTSPSPKPYLARSSRAVRVRGRVPSLWSFLAGPLRWAGVLQDAHAQRIPLFERYVESSSQPLAGVLVALRPARAEAVPEVLRASVTVRVRLGMVRSCLYMLRPGTLVALALAVSALGCVLGGGLGSFVLLALWVTAPQRRRRRARRAAAQQAGASERGAAGRRLWGRDRTQPEAGSEASSEESGEPDSASDEPARGWAGAARWSDSEDQREVVGEPEAAAAGKSWGPETASELFENASEISSTAPTEAEKERILARWLKQEGLRHRGRDGP